MDSQPPLTLGLALFVRAYSECSSCRSIGFGMGPIWHDSIVAWVARQNPPLDEDVGQLVERVVRIVDADALRKAAIEAGMRK